MAEIKKPAPADNDTFNKIVFWIFGLLLLAAFLERLNSALNSSFGGGSDSFWEAIGIGFLQHIWPVIKIFALVITVVGIFSISRILKKLKEIRMEENLLYGTTKESNTTEEKEVPLNNKWVQIETHINSKNPAEWRVAIIEADIMLDELLKTIGYHGDTVGDRLKAVEKSDFTTLEAAWEAHKVRNQIAHQGASFEINEREARRVISLYEVVFREFKII